jgi:hypothetical protein
VREQATLRGIAWPQPHEGKMYFGPPVSKGRTLWLVVARSTTIASASRLRVIGPSYSTCMSLARRDHSPRTA